MKRLLSASSLLATALMFSVAPSAMAQSTLGSIVDAGGKRLEANEVRALLVGHTYIRGNDRQTNSLFIDLQPDGFLTGNAATSLGASGVTGTWTLAEDGRLCGTYRYTQAQIRPVNFCGYHYLASGKYFAVPGKQIPNAPGYRVWIKGLDDNEVPGTEK